MMLSLAKTLGVLTFTPLTMLQASAQTVDFKVCRHFGEGQRNSQLWKMDLPRTNNYSQSWPTYRRRQDRLPGNSTEDSSCNWGQVNSRHDPTIDSAPCGKLTHWALILKLVRLLAGIQQWSYYFWHLTAASPREDDLPRQDSLLSPNTNLKEVI